MTEKRPEKTAIVREEGLKIFASDEKSMPWLSLLLDAYTVIDRGIEIAIGREKRKGKKRLACRDNCDVCCRANTDIPVYPLEISGITWYAVEKVAGPQRELLKNQLLAHTPGMPCPFLMDHRCAVYPVRPVACRQYIVFSRPCAEGEDPYHTRRQDVLSPIKEFTDQAIAIMLPFYGISGEAEKARAIKNGFIHTKVRNVHSCSWKTLAKKMEQADKAND